MFQLIGCEFIAHFKQYAQNGYFKPLLKVFSCCPWKARVCAFQKAEMKIFAKCFCSISKVKNFFSVEDTEDFLFLGNWQLMFPSTDTYLFDISFHFT